MDTLIGALAFTYTDLAFMVQNGIIVHFLNGHMDWCSGIQDAHLAAIVQKGTIVHLLDGYMDWCTDLHDTDLTSIV